MEYRRYRETVKHRHIRKRKKPDRRRGFRKVFCRI